VRQLVIAIVLVATSFALAQPPAAGERLVLADMDIELLHALETTLAPWKVAVVTYETAPATNDEANALAKDQGARFVAWRHEGQMIVYDVASGAADQQESKVGALDPADAAAAAELVKVLMHLPPLEAPEAPPPRPTTKQAQPVPDGGLELRGQLGFGIRVTRGDDRAIGVRIDAVVLARPWLARPWRFGVAGEAGPTASIEKAGFIGTWRDWAVLGLASWTFVGRTREVEPFIAAGVARSLVRGVEDTMARSEGTTMPLFRAGGWVRWHLGRWSVGGALSIDVTPTAPAFARRVDDGTLYQVSQSAIAFGLFGAADLGR
jgi:hypothetical protein